MKRNKGMIVLGFLLALILIVAGFLAVTYYNHNRAPEVPETTVPSTDAVTTSATAYTGELELPVAGGYRLCCYYDWAVCRAIGHGGTTSGIVPRSGLCDPGGARRMVAGGGERADRLGEA